VLVPHLVDQCLQSGSESAGRHVICSISLGSEPKAMQSLTGMQQWWVCQRCQPPPHFCSKQTQSLRMPEKGSLQLCQHWHFFIDISMTDFQNPVSPQVCAVLHGPTLSSSFDSLLFWIRCTCAAAQGCVSGSCQESSCCWPRGCPLDSRREQERCILRTS